MSNFHRGLAIALGCLIAAGLASTAHAAPSGSNWERAALQWRTQGQFDSAANGFQKAAAAFRAEGNAEGAIRALRESAAANEQYADSMIAGGGANAAAPGRPAPNRVAAAAPVAAGGLPTGRYACDFPGGGAPGYVDIRGGAYRGPDLEPAGGFSSYAMAGNAITWTAGFGEFTVVSSAYRGSDTNGRPWFSVTYSRTRGGGVDEIDCIRE